MEERSYNQNCALAHALDVIGERWSLVLIRELLIGPRRYKDLMDGLAGIGNNLLASRLKELELANIVERTILPPPAGSAVYKLTSLGRSLESAVQELIKWGFQLNNKGQPENLSRPEWDIVAMRSLFQPDAAKGKNGACQFQVEDVFYYVVINNGRVEIELGEIRCPDAIVTTDRKTLAKLGKGMDVNTAINNNHLQITGSVLKFSEMLALFKPGD